MRCVLVILLCLAGCSKGPDADLQFIKQARSLGAEWALINEQAAEGRLTRTYAASMHEWIRDQLETSSSALTEPDAPYAMEIRTLLQQPDDAPAETLRAHSDKLKTIEDSLESA